MSEQASAPDDVSAQVLWRTARAKALAATGRAHEAERLARDAVALAEQTDFLILHADAVADLGEVALASDIADAAAIVERARQLYEKKGNVVSAARLRELLAQT